VRGRRLLLLRLLPSYWLYLLLLPSHWMLLLLLLSHWLLLLLLPSHWLRRRWRRNRTQRGRYVDPSSG
jgi:hypothetical protein